MTAKSGSLLDCFNHHFQLTPITGAGTCMLRGEHIAVVPMRYALDRSSFDPEPEKLTPLLSHGQWAKLAELRTRQWTLRQLRSGYLYTYDETAGLFQEWLYDAFTADISPVVPEGAPSEKPRPYLLFPCTHRLHLAWAKWPWSPALREEIATSAASRERYMQALDLPQFCNRLVAEGALPLTDIAGAVADVVEGEIPPDDERFRDSYFPPQTCDADYVPLASQVLWTGGVPDQNNALFIALPDTLGAVAELCHQLTADQAAVDEWRERYQHRYLMAEQVEALCGPSADQAWLPKQVRGHLATRRYLQEVAHYFEALDFEEEQSLMTQNGLVLTPLSWKSAGLADHLRRTYGKLPPDAMYENWKARQKWRREVDLNEVHAFLNKQQAALRLLEERRDQTAHDLTVMTGHAGLDPKAVFIDIADASSLTHLYDVMVPAVVLLAQDEQLRGILESEEERTRSLLGLTRYGFSYELKRLFEEEADALFASTSDSNAAMGRLGELSSLLGHDRIQQSNWMRKLNKSTQLTFQHMVSGAKAGLKAHFEHLVLAFLPLDCEIAAKPNNLNKAFRNLWIGSVLMNSPSMVVDLQFDQRMQEWGQKVRAVKAELKRSRKLWHSGKGVDRVAMGARISDLIKQQKELMYQAPLLIDEKTNAHLAIVRSQILEAARNGVTTVARWNGAVSDWLGKLGGLGGGIAWAVVGMNVFNTAYVYNEITRFNEWTEQDWFKLKSAVGYTGQALASIWVGRAWLDVQHIHAAAGEADVNIFKRNAKFWHAYSVRTASWARLIKAFSSKLVVLGAFGIVGAYYEYADLSLDRKNIKAGLQKDLLMVKSSAVFGMGGLAVIQSVLGMLTALGYTSVATVTMGPWMMAVTVLLGVGYLAAHLLINLVKQDEIGAWLATGSWSRTEALRPFGVEREEAELQTMAELYNMPAIFSVFDFVYEYISQGRVYRVEPNASARRQRIQVLFPFQVRSEGVRVKLAATNKPFPGRAAELIKNNFRNEFLCNGQVMSEKMFGLNGFAKQEELNVQPPIEHDEAALWITWLDIPNAASYLEMEICYKSGLFAPEGGTRGYRFKIPLTDSGEVEPASKILPSDSRTLPSDAEFLRSSFIDLDLTAGAQL